LEALEQTNKDFGRQRGKTKKNGKGGVQREGHGTEMGEVEMIKWLGNV